MMSEVPRDSNPPGRDQRVHHRVTLDGSVYIEFEQELVESAGVNLSIGGVLVRAKGLVEVGSEVRVTVAPAGGEPMQLDAEVVRSSDGLVGLRFLRFNQTNLKALLKQLERGTIVDEDSD